MARTDLTDLLERIEAAEELTEFLCWELGDALQAHFDHRLNLHSFVGFAQKHAWVDASIVLCEAVLPGWGWCLSEGRLTLDEPLGAASLHEPDASGCHLEDRIIAEHQSVTLALLAAILEALIAKEKINEG